MEHYYEKIDGWFNFANIYKQVVEKLDSGIIVEVGTWKGTSAAYLGVEIVNSGKKIALHCVDTWEGAPEHLDKNNQFYEPILETPGLLYEEFIKNTEPLKDVITPLKMTSHEASRLYADNSLPFVFLDAAHDYENVKQDILDWWPKIKPGHILAGHDIYHNGVRTAVNEIFGTNYSIDNDSWLYVKSV